MDAISCATSEPLRGLLQYCNRQEGRVPCGVVERKRLKTPQHQYSVVLGWHRSRTVLGCKLQPNLKAAYSSIAIGRNTEFCGVRSSKEGDLKPYNNSSSVVIALHGSKTEFGCKQQCSAWMQIAAQLQCRVQFCNRKKGRVLRGVVERRRRTTTHQQQCIV